MFWDVFYKLCSDNGTNPTSVVAELNIANGAPTKWKKGAIPNAETLLKLADYFNVSVDYLIGKEKKLPISGELSENEKTIIGLLRSGTKEDEKSVLDYIQFVYGQKK